MISHPFFVAALTLVGLGMLTGLFALYNNPLMELYLATWFIC